MSGEKLSQEQIDALLKAVNEGEGNAGFRTRSRKAREISRV